VTTVAWFHCFAGIAGDMALGSLVDAGADLALVERELNGLPVGGWRVEAVPTTRSGIACTRVEVHTSDRSVVRTYGHIVGLITEARLPQRARDRALATFARLAEVEGRLHRRPQSQVHFHEVGSVDAIVDIVGTCLALEVLGVDEVRSSPVAQGSGMVRSAHGVLPVPAPAVVELLRGAPTFGTNLPVELTTPTGAALLAALGSGWGPMPTMEITASGFGAGARELDGLPNAVQVVLGTPVPADHATLGQPLVLLETNVDDVTGEVLGHAVEALLASGARDAWVAPIIGKKGRPAHVLTALCDADAVPALRQVMVAETGTLGARSTSVQRWAASRDVVTVEVDGVPVRVKRGPRHAKAEFDDAARAAARLGLPAREVARRAETAADRMGEDEPDPVDEPPPVA
jgi:hypothetical protein